MIANILPLIGIIILGYSLKKFDIIKKEEGKTFSTLLINVILPALIILNFSQLEFSLNYLKIMLASAIVILILFGFGFVFSKTFGFDKKTTKSTVIIFSCMWGATIGFPFVLQNFGNEGFTRILIFDLVNTIFILTVLHYIASSHKNSIKKNLSNVLKTPLIISLFVAIIINILNINITFLTGFLNIITKTTIFIGLLIVGLNFEFKITQFKYPIIILSLKYLIGIIFGLIFAKIFGITGLDKTILIIGTSLPPTLMAMIYAQQYDLNKELVASTLTLGLISGIIIISLVGIYI